MLGWIACALSLIGIILNGRKRMLCWPVWILADVLWLFYAVGQPSLIALQLIFMVANTWGWYQWMADRNLPEPLL